MPRPTLRLGSHGSEVMTVQTCLAVTPVDGDFGSKTESAVQGFQLARDLTADGVVGSGTWSAFEDEFDLPPYPPALLPPLDPATVNAIVRLAAASPIASYSWRDRGRAPAGYTKGMALAYAETYRRYHAFEASAREMAKANTGNADKDALAWYDAEFRALGMNNNIAGVDTLRHLFVLMMGLGMRESSGKHCEGRDQSADNVTSDTAEAGAWQQSWNSNSSSTDMQKLLDSYAYATDAQCAIDTFEEGVSCSSSSWSCYGSGTGLKFQKLAKSCPQFAVEMAGIGLRRLKAHWGPIQRFEAELRREADDMFRAIQKLVPIEAPPVVEIPTITIAIDPPGSAYVLVIGAAE